MWVAIYCELVTPHFKPPLCSCWGSSSSSSKQNYFTFPQNHHYCRWLLWLRYKCRRRGTKLSNEHTGARMGRELGLAQHLVRSTLFTPRPTPQPSTMLVFHSLVLSFKCATVFTAVLSHGWVRCVCIQGVRVWVKWSRPPQPPPPPLTSLSWTTSPKCVPRKTGICFLFHLILICI